MNFMLSRTNSIFLVITISVLALAQTTQQQIANLDKMIQHYKDIEASQGKLLADLKNGSVFMVKQSNWSEPAPMRTSDLREYIVSLAIAAELGKANPDIAAAEKRANDSASRFINSCREFTDKKKSEIEITLSQVRTNRQKLEAQRERMRLAVTPGEPKIGNFAGHWNTSVGRFAYPRDLNMDQAGAQVNGTWSHRTGEGTIKGTVRGNVLTFKYTEHWASNGQSGTDTGVGTFTLSNDGKSFSGSYTSDLPEGDKGNGWRGTRAR